MEINIGMSRKGLMEFANELRDACLMATSQDSIEVTRYIACNGSGPELVLTLSNDDMERPETQDAAYWGKG